MPNLKHAYSDMKNHKRLHCLSESVGKGFRLLIHTAALARLYKSAKPGRETVSTFFRWECSMAKEVKLPLPINVNGGSFSHEPAGAVEANRRNGSLCLSRPDHRLKPLGE